jgi:hypothetical protein
MAALAKVLGWKWACRACGGPWRAVAALAKVLGWK